MMKTTRILCFFLYIIKFVGGEFEVHQSALPLVQVGPFGYEFQLKQRDNNLTVEIRPSPTLRQQLAPSNTSVINERDYVTREEQSEQSVPPIASLYYYDKEMVKLLKAFLEDHQRSMNMSSQQQNLIQRYVEEWDKSIDESKDGEESLPNEIEKLYKLVRMSHRVSTELANILNFSRDISWAGVIDEAQEAETNMGNYFSGSYREMLSYSMLRLSETYFMHPWELYPADIFNEIPIKDLVSVALSGNNEYLVKEAVEWLSFASSISDKINRGESSTFGSTPGSRLENDERTEEKLADRKNSTAYFDQNYLSILLNIFNFQLEATEQSKESQPRNPSLLTYQNLCNGLYLRAPFEMATLNCRYDNLNAPWLYLMPAKVELVFRNPDIIFFHQVLTDSKIKKLQELALQNQKEAATLSDDGHFVQTNTLARDSHATFVPSILTSEVMDTNKITAYLTGLQTVEARDAENLQVNVYKPGGQYVRHIDAFGEETILGARKLKGRFMPNGDRIATLMFYLNDIERGGKTVFTELGLSLTPEKGGAVLWYSLFNDGEIDKRTQHAGCPVISGVKWVVNKWIHYNSQLFKRPCLAK